MTHASDDLLVRLVNYRLSDDRTRREDYLTECFAWLLANDSDARMELLRPGGLVYDDDHAELAPPPGAEIDVTSQEALSPRDRPDVVLRGKDALLIIEAKVDARFDPGQIRRYLRHAARCRRGGVVALVPRSSFPNSDARPQHGSFLGVVAWEDVATLIADLPADDGSVGTYRRWFLRLLEHYGLRDDGASVAWADDAGGQRIDEVRRLCGIFDSVVAKLGQDATVAAAAPPIYLHDGRLELSTAVGVSGAGPAPRPILQHDTILASVHGYFFNFIVHVFFQGTKYTRASRGGRVGIQLENFTSHRAWRENLGHVRRALGRAVPADDEEAIALLGRVRDRFHRRCDETIVRFSDSLKEAGIPVPEDATCYHDWCVNYPIAQTTDLCPVGAEPGEVRDRYEEWLRTIIQCWFEAEPTKPLAYLAMETSMG